MQEWHSDADMMFSLKDVCRKYETPYEMEKSVADSIREIKTCLDKKTYRYRFEAEEHITFLERIENKLTVIMSLERNASINNLSLSAKLDEIKQLIIKLKLLISSLPDKKVFTDGDDSVKMEDSDPFEHTVKSYYSFRGSISV